MNVAVPLVSVPLPTKEVPLKKLTEPVGVPLPVVGATFAVITTGPLDFAVMVVGESDNVVVVGVVPDVCTVNC